MKYIEGIFYLSFFVVMLVFIFPYFYNTILDQGYTTGIGTFLNLLPYVFIVICILIPIVYLLEMNESE